MAQHDLDLILRTQEKVKRTELSKLSSDLHEVPKKKPSKIPPVTYKIIWNPCWP